MDVLITGAGGFIGKALCRRLSSYNKVIGIDIIKKPDKYVNIAWEQTDLTNFNSMRTICKNYSPDLVIHCAGVAHQKIGAVDAITYMRVNSEVTENLAKATFENNPDVCFIFLSSISVYGEENLSMATSEESEGNPSSDYALSKLDAERRLIALYNGGNIHKLFILRLAPVYDREWSLNLDRRVFAPKKLTYLRFGSGLQKMSALARPNLIDFIEFLLQRGLQTQGVNILNLCDTYPYELNQIINVFRRSNIQVARPIIPVPLSLVWIATRLAGSLFHDKRKWLHSCYDKVASDILISNRNMLRTGFKPRFSLETVFSPRK